MPRKTPPGSVGFDWNLARIASRRRLPHVVQANTVYFITLRLADSIPRIKLDQWNSEIERWLTLNPSPHTPAQEEQYAELGYRRVERWLDQGAGSCVLKDQRLRTAVEACLHHCDGKDYWLGDYAIMPNHVHALVRPDACSLKHVVDPWRTVTTQKINKLLGRQGRLWQEDPFDHIVRNQQSLDRIRKYIRDNGNRLPPAWFTIGEGLLFSSARPPARNESAR